MAKPAVARFDVTGSVIGPDRTGGSGHVTFYVEVDDPTAYVARAEKLAGKTVVPPTDVPEFGLTFAFFRRSRRTRGGALERGHPVGGGVCRPLSRGDDARNPCVHAAERRLEHRHVPTGERTSSPGRTAPAAFSAARPGWPAP